MKQIITKLIAVKLFALAIAFAGHSSPLIAQDKKERIGIVSFRNGSQYRDSAISNGLLQELTTALSKNKKYQLVERAQLEAVIGEMKLGMEGITDDAAAQMGKLASLDYVVTGDVTEISVNVTDSSFTDKNGRRNTSYRKVTTVGINIKMIDINGNIAFSESERRNSSESSSSHPSNSPNSAVVSKLGREAIDKIIMRMGIGNEAVVVQVKGDVVTIDMGSNDGVLKGMRFRIIAEGDVIKDRNGEVIGMDEVLVAYLTIDEVSATLAKGKVSHIKKAENDRGKKVKQEVVPGLLVRQVDGDEARGTSDKIMNFLKR